MATPVIMPRQGQSVESCIITKWFVKKGDRVKAGDPLFAYETDKAAFEEAADIDGTVLDIFFKEGDDVPVLTNVCVIGEEGESYAEFIPGGEKEKPAEPEEQRPQMGGTAEGIIKEDTGEAIKEEKPAPGEELKVSPRAKNLAERTGVDIRFASPTGPHRRIIERDIRKLQQQGVLVTPGAKDAYLKLSEPVTGSGIGGRVTTRDLETAEKTEVPAEVSREIIYEDIPLTNIRKVIAKTMHESLSQMAQLTLNISFDATNIINYRQMIKANIEKFNLSNITLNDILIYAVSRVLPGHKTLNAHFLGDRIRCFANVNMGIAVDTERGLMVPTLFDANLKSLNEISMEAKELAQACQKGSINPDKLQGGTFTVTNLGALGIESFTPVINPPQTAILGVNTIEKKFREKDGEIEAYLSMSLSLTFDHRAVDGAPAARFLKDLKEYLENFTVILAKG